MKKAEYIEKFPYNQECVVSPEEIDRQVKELKNKLSRKGIALCKNYKTRKIRVMWDGTSSSVIYPFNYIKLL